MTEDREQFSMLFMTGDDREVKVTVEYPKNQALLGVQGLKEAASHHYMEQILVKLLDENEPSVVASYDQFVTEEMDDREF